MKRERADAADTLTERALAIREVTFTNAAALERLHGLRRSALGITDEGVNSDEVPELLIHNFIDANIIAMRRKQAEEDDLNGDIPDEAPLYTNDIVFEIEDS